MKEIELCKKRSRIYGVCGLATLGAGIPVTLVGVACIAMTAVNDNSGSLVSGSVATLLGVGGGLMVASIPLIVLSHRYSKKAKSLELKMNQYLQGKPSSKLDSFPCI